MPGNWTSIETRFPSFTGEEGVPEQIKMLHEYMYILTEQLKYNLANLDTGNWNSEALSKFSESVSKGATDQLAKMVTELEKLRETVGAVGNRVASVSQTVATQGQNIDGVLKIVQPMEKALHGAVEQLINIERQINSMGEELATIRDQGGTAGGMKFWFDPDGIVPEDMKEGDVFLSPDEEVEV